MSQCHCLILLLKLLLLPMSAFSENALNVPSSSGPPQLNRNETYVINAGDTLLLECRGTKNVTWVHNHEVVDDDEYFTEDWLCSKTADLPYCSAFKLEGVFAGDTGLYRCEYQDNRTSYDTSMVYVQDSEELIVYDNHVYGVVGAKLVLRCLPTFPDISLSLEKNGNDVTDDFTWEPTNGFIKDVGMVGDSGVYKCRSTDPNYLSDPISVSVEAKKTMYPAFDDTCDAKEYVAGIDFQLTCYVHTESDLTFYWTLPNNNVIEKIPVAAERGWKSTMLITQPTVEDSGEYTCRVEGDYVITTQPASHILTVIDPCSGIDYVQLENRLVDPEVKEGHPFIWRVEIKAFPPNPLLIYRLNNNVTYVKNQENCTMENPYSIVSVTHKHFGNYSLEVQTQEVNQSNCNEDHAFKMVTNSTSMFLRVKSHPIIKSLSAAPAVVADGKSVVMVATCIVIAYPEPNIAWYFEHDNEHSTISLGNNKTVKLPPDNIWNATIELQTPVSGNLTCEASNSLGTISETVPVNITATMDDSEKIDTPIKTAAPAKTTTPANTAAPATTATPAKTATPATTTTPAKTAAPSTTTTPDKTAPPTKGAAASTAHRTYSALLMPVLILPAFITHFL